MSITIRDAHPKDFTAVLALNTTFEHHLSKLDTARLALLHAQASYHRVVELDGAVVAFLMAHCEGTGYDSDNYAWFSAKYTQFTYIDRVVVGQAAQGLGVGRRLYDDVFAWAKNRLSPCVVLEFDVEPPNIISEQFHAKMGFTSVGIHTSTSTGKRANMQIKIVT